MTALGEPGGDNPRCAEERESPDGYRKEAAHPGGLLALDELDGDAVREFVVDAGHAGAGPDARLRV